MTFLAEALPPQTELSLRRQVVAYAELRGWRCYWTWRSDHSPSGFPDLVLVRARHPKPRVAFVELKAERGRLTLAQRTWLAELEEAGAETHVWRPSDMDEIIRVLR